MNIKRRRFIETATGAAVTLSAIGAGILVPQRVLGAYPMEAFKATSVDAALSGSVGSSQYSPSDAIKLKAPDIAENGAVVPITVTSTLDNVDSISIVATNNPAPLTSYYKLSSGSEAYVSTRIKMGKTSEVIAVVKADGKLYSDSKEVKVTIGGCGG